MSKFLTSILFIMTSLSLQAEITKPGETPTITVCRQDQPSKCTAYTYYRLNGERVPEGTAVCFFQNMSPWIPKSGVCGPNPVKDRLVDGAAFEGVWNSAIEAAQARERLAAPSTGIVIGGSEGEVIATTGDNRLVQSKCARGSFINEKTTDLVRWECDCVLLDPKGWVDVGGGCFHRDINASMSDGALGKTSSLAFEGDYNTKNLEIDQILFGAMDIGDKTCRASGKEMPKSATHLFAGAKAYIQGDHLRELILKERMYVINKRMEALSVGADSSKNIQIEGLQLQIDSLNAGIDSLSGSVFYKEDLNDFDVKWTARIPLKKSLMEVLVKAANSALDERSNYYNKFVNLDQGFEEFFAGTSVYACENRAVAAQSCKAGFEGVNCKAVDEISFVRECEIVNKSAKEMRAGQALQHYLLTQSMASSQEFDLKLGKIENDLLSMISGLSKSGEAKPEWITKINKASDEFVVARKDMSITCADSGIREGYNRDMFDSVDKVEVKAQDVDVKFIADSGKKYLRKMGMPQDGVDLEGLRLMILKIGDDSEDAYRLYHSYKQTWTISDAALGVAGSRFDYIINIMQRLEVLIEADKKKLADMTVQKTKLEEYLETIKKSLETPATKPLLAAAPKSSNSASNRSAVNTKTLGSTNYSADQIKHLNLKKSELATIASKNAALPLNVVSSVGAVNSIRSAVLEADALKMNGNLSKAITVSDAAAGSVSNSIKAPGVSGASIISSDKVKNNFSSAMADAFEKADTKNLATKMAAISASGGAGTIGSSATSSGSSGSSGDGSSSAASIGGSGSKGGGFQDYGYFSGGGSSGGSSRSSYSSSTGSNDNKNSTSDEDKKRVSQSIIAKKSDSKEKYESSKSDSLFERVTKAYFRNYEKVNDDSIESAEDK